jgi:hypothetical protein
MTSEGKEQIENSLAPAGKSRSSRRAYILLVILLTVEAASGSPWMISFISVHPGGWNNIILDIVPLAIFIICAIALLFRKNWGFYGLIAQHFCYLYVISAHGISITFFVYAAIANLLCIGGLFSMIKADEKRRI